MKKIYMAVGQESGRVTVLGYYATESLARARCERIIAESPITVAYAANVERGVSTGWEPWQLVTKQQPDRPDHNRSLNARTITTWVARSVGGQGGNPWTSLSVVEANVEENAVDQLAEIVR